MSEVKNESEFPADEQKPLKPEEQAYMDFINKNRARCEMWAKAHGNVNFPIIETESGFVWLNRKRRRSIPRQG